MGFGLIQLMRRIWRGADALFVIEISAAGVEVAEGSAPRSFIEDCEAIATTHELSRGTITAVGSRRDATLRFSSHIPDGVRQRLRNSWSFASRR